jgi:hypothetical protein
VPARRPTRAARLALALVAAAVVVALAAYGLTTLLNRPTKPQPVAGCTVGSGSGAIGLDLEQGAHAATIAAIGKRRGLPDHAVTIALAAALQESRLHNLPGGDRDSVGLFQQRPSQGWGTPAQLHDPRFATAAFYAHLARVPGWETLPVTVAAQRVQRSAAPDAYADWEPQARVLAAALTGEQPATFSCRYLDRGPADDDPLAVAIAAELGAPVLGARLSKARGWTAASWLVAHADGYRLAAVSFGGRTWTRTSARWQPDARAPAAVITVRRLTS